MLATTGMGGNGPRRIFSPRDLLRLFGAWVLIPVLALLVLSPLDWMLDGQLTHVFTPLLKRQITTRYWLLNGTWELRRGRPFEAVQALEKGVRLATGRHDRFYHRLAEAHRLLGDTDTADLYASLSSSPSPPVTPSLSSALAFKVADRGINARDRQERLLFGIHQIMGPGACVADVDSDGWEDLFVQEGLGSSVLFLNREGVFERAGENWRVRKEGRGIGCLFADLDNDGLPDLILSNYGPNQVFRNTGKGFVEVRGAATGEPGDFSTCLTAADVDGNGLLDLYVGNYVDAGHLTDLPRTSGRWLLMREYSPFCCPAQADRFYVNRGGFQFEENTELFLSGPSYPTLGCVFADVGGDRRVDLLVAHDAYPNRLYLQGPTGAFREAANDNRIADARAGMGLALAYLNNDRRLDFFITHLMQELHALYVSDPAGGDFYRDEALTAGIARPAAGNVGFGAGFFDMDHDGLQDLFIVNGHIYPATDTDPMALIPQPDQLFLQTAPGRFQEASGKAGPYFRARRVGRGAAFFDFDRDGDVDVLVTHNNGPALLVENSGPPKGNWLQIVLRGKAPTIPVGATVEAALGGRVMRRQLTLGESYLSGNSPVQHFGVGGGDCVERLTVTWPDGRTRVYDKVAVNRRLLISEQTDTLPPCRPAAAEAE